MLKQSPFFREKPGKSRSPCISITRYLFSLWRGTSCSVVRLDEKNTSMRIESQMDVLVKNILCKHAILLLKNILLQVLRQCRREETGQSGWESP